MNNNKGKLAGTKLLLHISDRDKWVSVLSLATRLMDDGKGKHTEIIIIADIFAGAVCIACNKGLKQQMVDFVKAGQKIIVCEESIKCLNIPVKSLPDFTHSVPIGLAEIMRLQGDGFRYIKT